MLPASPGGERDESPQGPEQGLLQLPIELQCQIISFLGHHKDVVRVSGTCTGLRAALQRARLPLVVEDTRVASHPWAQMLRLLEARCPSMTSLSLLNSNVTDECILEGLRGAEAGCLQELVVSRCYGVTAATFTRYVSQLSCVCIRDMSSVPAALGEYSSLRILGLTNGSFTGTVMTDMARLILSGGLPVLEYVFLGGGRGPVPSLKEVAEMTEEGAGSGSSPLRVIEATFWSPMEKEVLSRLLRPAASSRRQPTGVVDLNESPVEELDLLLQPPPEQREALRRVVRVATICTSRDGRLRTPLHLACCSQDHTRVRWLLRHGAQVNARDNRGNTPLYRASEVGAAEAVAALLQYKADVWCRNQMREGSLYIASLRGWAQVVRLLVGHLVEQASGEGGRARRADERGSRLSTTDGDGFTPLHAGVIGQNRDVLATILESGLFDVDATNRSRQTALHLLARGGRTDLAEVLLDHGADVNALDEGRMSPLDVALHFGHSALAAMLEERGARPGGRRSRPPRGAGNEGGSWRPHSRQVGGGSRGGRGGGYHASGRGGRGGGVA